MKRDAAVYAEAARLLETMAPNAWGNEGSPYSCDRIGQACGHFTPESGLKKLERFRALKSRYREIFCPDVERLIWWPSNEAGRDARVIALCLMAAMVETGDA